MEEFARNLKLTETQVESIKSSNNPYVEWLIQGTISRTIAQQIAPAPTPVPVPVPQIISTPVDDGYSSDEVVPIDDLWNIFKDDE